MRGVDGDVAYSVAEEKTRSRQADLFVLVWWVILLTIGGVVSQNWTTSRIVWWVCILLAALRVVDIFQTNVNKMVFARLREGRKYRHASAVRSLILAVTNYVELIGWFGAIYATDLTNLEKASGYRDAYYFSAVTQLTVGYGDLLPLAWLRVVATMQATIGFIFGVAIVARAVNALPAIEPVVERKR